VKPQDFDYIRLLMRERSGLVLAADKVYLVESRLLPVARRRGFASIEELIQAVRQRREEILLVEITDAMTTNESFFFRDIKPFDSLREAVLPQLVAARKAAGKNAIRIWCAACSSGQEPYSIAMMLKEHAAAFAGFRFDIVATDLSTEILAKATAGIYTQFEVQRGLPIQLLLKYFKKNGDLWQIDPGIRGMVTYRLFNLLDSFAPLGAFDVVFCRNVLIYFDQPTKSDVLKRLSKQMPADGALFLGGAESVMGLTEAFKPMPGQRGIYVQSGAPEPSALRAAAAG
jgi:chemotaxis protein methyltransferase CheR